jgi:hypothetical protein
MRGGGGGGGVDGRVDLTPAEPGSLTATVQVRLLVETELGNKERKLLDYGVHAQALSLLQERERVRACAALVQGTHGGGIM